MQPGAATLLLVESIVRNQKRIVPCSVYLNGEYGQKDICMGVPVVLGRNGWEKIVNLRLSDAEKAAFEKSAEAVRSMNGALTLS
jgi:malate dehydrogenase